MQGDHRFKVEYDDLNSKSCEADKDVNAVQLKIQKSIIIWPYLTKIKTVSLLTPLKGCIEGQGLLPAISYFCFIFHLLDRALIF